MVILCLWCCFILKAVTFHAYSTVKKMDAMSDWLTIFLTRLLQIVHGIFLEIWMCFQIIHNIFLKSHEFFFLLGNHIFLAEQIDASLAFYPPISPSSISGMQVIPSSFSCMVGLCAMAEWGFWLNNKIKPLLSTSMILNLSHYYCCL